MENYQLSEAIETHFHATNTDNPTAFLSAFHDDAVVVDAGKEYRGKDAIKEWSDQTYFGDHLRLEITNISQNSGETVVTATADGNFDKTGLPDPLFLDFHFILEGNKIKLLRIVLSSNSRAVLLSPPIAAFYHASDVYDGALLASCIAEDAILYDEGEELHGSAAISAHIFKANKDAKVMMDIMRCAEKGRDIIVTAMLTGEFEGSPVSLDFHFTLAEGKIKALNITLEGE